MRRAEPALADPWVPAGAVKARHSGSPPTVRPRRGGDATPRRLLGAFYTPDGLAIVLTRWALTEGPGTVLDPSYGGCAFLRAAVNVLAEQNANDPQRLVFGVDIDRKCTRYAGGIVVPENHITADFLALSPGAIPGAPFKAIVGNPPYVRHHWLKGARRRAATDVAKRARVKLRGTASTWAYFVLHALNFLAPNGRLAILVPEAILQADYAKVIRDLLRKRFARVVFVHVRDRIFTETDEPVVVVAAEGIGPGIIRTESIESADDLSAVLERTAPASPDRLRMNNGREVTTVFLDLLSELACTPAVSTLGALATVRIGFVTGSNHFFIRSQKDAQRLGIPAHALEPVVGRTQWLSGLAFTIDDHRQLTELGRRTLLVRPRQATRHHAALRRWIEEGRIEGICLHHKCAVRKPWYRVDSGPKPDCFVTCSRMSPPLLVINGAGYRCSNALHALRWHHPLPVSPKAIAVAFLSSLTALWAEIHGRRYGGGVLKLEPGTLRSIPVPLLPGLNEAFDDIDTLLRAGHEERARNAADEAVLRNGLGVSARHIALLQRARRDLGRQRLPSRNGALA